VGLLAHWLPRDAVVMVPVETEEFQADGFRRQPHLDLRMVTLEVQLRRNRRLDAWSQRLHFADSLADSATLDLASRAAVPDQPPAVRLYLDGPTPSST
jgi:hypothetical protein